MVPPNRILLPVAMLVLALATNLGSGQTAVLANAVETPTPTPTRTATATFTPTVTATAISTPDNLDKKKIDANKTATALAKDVVVTKIETANADRHREIDARRNPASPTAVVPSPTPDPNIITIRRQDFDTVIKTGVDTALAARSTPTPVVIRERVIERVVEERGGDGGGLPGIVWLMGGFLGGSLAFARRQQIKDRVTQSGIPNWRVVNWVRTHGGNRVVLSRPVQFAWRQVGRLHGI